MAAWGPVDLPARVTPFLPLRQLVLTEGHVLIILLGCIPLSQYLHLVLLLGFPAVSAEGWRIRGPWEDGFAYQKEKDDSQKPLQSLPPPPLLFFFLLITTKMKGRRIWRRIK